MRRLLLLLALCSIPAIALADAESDQWIEQGLTLREQGKDAEALLLFEKANAKSPSPRALAQIALAQQALGRFVLADKHLSSALASSDPWITSRKAALESALAAIRKRLARLTVTVNVPGAKVKVNGQDAGTGALTILAGKTKIEVTAAGYTTFSKTVELAPEAQQTEAVTLTKLASKPAVAAISTPAEPGPGEPKTWEQKPVEATPPPVVKEPEAKPDPPAHKAKPAEKESVEPALTSAPPPAASDGGETLRTLGYISVATAGAALVLGVILLATAPDPLLDRPFDCEFSDTCPGAGQETAGAVFLVSAGVFGAAGVGMLVAGYSDGSGTTAQVTLSPTGAVGRLTF